MSARPRSPRAIVNVPRLPAVLALLLASSFAACSDDGGSGSSDATADTGRPGRADDAADPSDTAGGSDVRPAPAPPQDFATAWDEHLDRLKRNAAFFCPCAVSLGIMSASGCASEVAGQVDQQAFCIRMALARTEPNAVGYMTCMNVYLDEGNTCFQALENPGCTNVEACNVDPRAEADCRLLLTDEQRQGLDGCAPEENDR